jgi:lipopolysaccharide transport system ATP-binding protein
MSMGQIAISVERLGKQYRIGHAAQRPDNVRAAVGSFVTAPFAYLRSRLREPSADELFWALKDVSFEVKSGEVLGIIGRNGAGKSTLLKILSRITEPTEGCAKVYGRVGSLLEVGTGFHPELTGRENIYLNGAILGMKRAEIDKKFDEIVDFSGVEKFLDTPVKRYSSGMYVRLAFAVAAHLEPEILIVDEVLAVGDAEFQKKCLGKMGEASQEGRTVIFVSHNMVAVQFLCQRAIWLHEGSIAAASTVETVIKKYVDQIVNMNMLLSSQETLDNFPRGKDLVPVYQKGYCNNAPLAGSHTVLPEQKLSFRLFIELMHAWKNCTFGIHFEDELGNTIYALHTRWLLKPIDLKAGSYQVNCQTENIPLVPQSYYLSIGFSSEGKQIDWLSRVARIDIAHYDVYGTGELPLARQGYFLSRCDWNISAMERSAEEI